MLTSAEVRGAAPKDAERRGGLDYAVGEESVLDGPLRLWRLAAQARLGLCGVSLVLD
ncbi:hypothetical protein [Streptomyces sp. LaPpAH-108]|uniref:hypothetical protein n=1 Tax=Streptomyces sp. LaPpAH-108 TaxID=1155714 RepID=UPI00131A15ED|nr:hypothetical protein [Streptomyces sp. LaPpAH-108]